MMKNQRFKPILKKWRKGRFRKLGVRHQGLGFRGQTLRDCPKSLKITFASLHFAKVLITRRATTFGKVDYKVYNPDNQLLLEYVM